MKKIVLTIAIVIIVAGAGLLWYLAKNQSTSPENQKQSQPPPTVATSTNITVTNPQAYQIITSPLNISGQAKGTWYFEASFPIKLLDGNGNQIAQTIATAQSDWMTTNFVPFTATLNFTMPSTATGTLIFEKDNPSGLPANADQISIPINF